MPHAFEQTLLWQRTLADRPEDSYRAPRQALRLAYLQFRATVEPLAAEIARSMPMFTDHSIAHIDALWDTASLVTGNSFPINAAEAFVLGGAFLLHDVGMGLTSFSGGLAEIEADPSFDDLFASARRRLQRADPFGTSEAVERAAREETIANLLRLRHAAQAERLVTATFQTSDGESFYLLQNVVLGRRSAHSSGGLQPAIGGRYLSSRLSNSRKARVLITPRNGVSTRSRSHVYCGWLTPPTSTTAVRPPACTHSAARAEFHAITGTSRST